jgi:hypothetical protein
MKKERAIRIKSELARGVHPRVFYTATEIAALKERALSDAGVRQQIERISQTCETLLTKPLLTEEYARAPMTQHGNYYEVGQLLADFADKAEYHSTDAYPTEIIFFANGEIYEIIYIPIGGESMILHAIKMCQDNTAGNRIFIVNDIEQINKIDFENSFFATVDMKCGAVQYYKKE